MRNNRNNQNGSALVALIFFTLIAIIYTSAAIIIMSINAGAATSAQLGVGTGRLAESALEDTFLRLIRNPNYAGGTFNIDGGSATVVVTGSTLKDIDVTVDAGSFVRKYEAQVQFNNTEMTILSWKEAF